MSLSFLFILCVPHIAELWDGGTDMTSVEKRSMAKMPDSGLMLDSFAEYGKSMEKFYNDSFGLRDSLIRWNNRLRLLAFNESPVRGVRVGREGWLFLADEWAFEDYENVMPFRTEELSRMGRILNERLAWLERRGIKFIVLVAPNKHTVYSEYLPRDVRKLGKESRLDQVAGLMKSLPGIEFIDLREPLLSAKPDGRLYHRTDTHWNDYGAFVGYRELMERVARHFPNVRKPSLENYIVSLEEGEGGDLARMLSLSDVIREERITLTLKSPSKAVNAMRPYPDPVDRIQNPGRDMVVKETRDPRLPKALVFRDSYSWALIPILSEGFQSAVFVWTFEFLPDLIEREKPDLVIFQCVERYIASLSIENPPGLGRKE